MELNQYVDFTSNQESNLFLRCLWSRIRHNFGRLAWQIMPCYDAKKKSVDVGNADIGMKSPILITLFHKKRDNKCLSRILFRNFGSVTNVEWGKIVEKLKLSVDEARNYNQYISEHFLEYTFHSSLVFKKSEATNFNLENNNYKFKILGFDTIDIKAYGTSLIQIINDLLSFDILRPIYNDNCKVKNCFDTEYRIVFCNSEGKPLEDNKEDNEEEDSRFELSDTILVYIENLINREFNYLEPLNRFEKAINFFTQGLIFERLQNTELRQYIKPSENAIVCYMSSLEIITLEDIKSTKCDVCKMEKFSIAKRVKELVKNASNNDPYQISLVTDYYNLRSKFVHTGELTSSNNYGGTSIPLIGKKGLIPQVYYLDTVYKQYIKNYILYHELDKDGNINSDF